MTTAFLRAICCLSLLAGCLSLDFGTPVPPDSFNTGDTLVFVQTVWRHGLQQLVGQLVFIFQVTEPRPKLSPLILTNGREAWANLRHEARKYYHKTALHNTSVIFNQNNKSAKCSSHNYQNLTFFNFLLKLNIGMHQHVVLGQRLKKRYTEDIKFLPTNYESSKIYIRSTDVNRYACFKVPNNKLLQNYFERRIQLDRILQRRQRQ